MWLCTAWGSTRYRSSRKNTSIKTMVMSPASWMPVRTCESQFLWRVPCWWVTYYAPGHTKDLRRSGCWVIEARLCWRDDARVAQGHIHGTGCPGCVMSFESDESTNSVLLERSSSRVLGYPKLLVRVIDVTCIAVQGCGTFQGHHGMRLLDCYASSICLVGKY
jgi:hypothetical protein